MLDSGMRGGAWGDGCFRTAFDYSVRSACLLPARERVCVSFSNLSVRLGQRNVSLRPATPANLIRCFIVTRLNAFERRQIQMD